jgi:hypothetical protein
MSLDPIETQMSVESTSDKRHCQSVTVLVNDPIMLHLDVPGPSRGTLVKQTAEREST